MIFRSSLERSCNENQPLSCPQPENTGHPKQCSVSSDNEKEGMQELHEYILTHWNSPRKERKGQSDSVPEG